ncbi:hypothetical protein Anapl_18102 [Anas platyrhynchos]|uniref:Uncharacterized protein n=1 Tax=Anas platyrhynchos TaxID=8839 RepID=R0KX89_ANAPL|nr:hypothetical protein Anapl_18102 [Anas platyrhynchos]
MGLLLIYFLAAVWASSKLSSRSDVRACGAGARSVIRVYGTGLSLLISHQTAESAYITPTSLHSQQRYQPDNHCTGTLLPFHDLSRGAPWKGKGKGKGKGEELPLANGTLDTEQHRSLYPSTVQMKMLVPALKPELQKNNCSQIVEEELFCGEKLRVSWDSFTHDLCLVLYKHEEDLEEDKHRDLDWKVSEQRVISELENEQGLQHLRGQLLMVKLRDF